MKWMWVLLLATAACHNASGPARPFATVARADLSVLLSDLGEVGSEEEIRLLAPFAGKLESMKAEGSLVRKGEVVASMDTQKEREEVETMQLDLAQKRLDMQIARAGNRARRQELTGRLQIADLGVKIEKLKLEGLARARDAAGLVEVQHQLAAASEQLGYLDRALPEIETLLARGHLPRSEVARLMRLQKELRLQRQAHGAHKAELERGSPRQDRAKQEGLVALAKLEREKALRSLQAFERTGKLDEDLVALQMQGLKDKIAENRAMIARGTIVAPPVGLLVYGKIDWEDTRVRPGESVSEGQTVAQLSNPTRPLVRVGVNGLDIARVQVGQPAWFTLDASPGRRFKGRVVRIADMGQSRFNRDVKDVQVFQVEVRGEANPLIRPGMTANTDIEVYRATNSLVVPLDAVREDASGSYCMTAAGLRVAVKVLATNETSAAIAGPSEMVAEKVAKMVAEPPARSGDRAGRNLQQLDVGDRVLSGDVR